LPGYPIGPSKWGDFDTALNLVIFLSNKRIGEGLACNIYSRIHYNVFSNSGGQGSRIDDVPGGQGSIGNYNQVGQDSHVDGSSKKVIIK
jgi:hypothetical protein